MLNKTQVLPDYLNNVKGELEQCKGEDLQKAAKSFATGMVNHKRTENEEPEMPEYLKRVQEDLERCTEEELRVAIRFFLMDIAGCEGARRRVSDGGHISLASLVESYEESERLNRIRKELEQCSEEDLKEVREFLAKDRVEHR